MLIEAKTRDEWLEMRLKGIGASEASSILGCNPYKSNVVLWEEKTGRRIPEDISNNPVVLYGKNAEEPLRHLFALDFPQYDMAYSEFGMIANDVKHPYLFATLDGILTEKTTGKTGILEIKTTEILNNSQWAKWENQVPPNYYAQILHQFLATGYEFAWLKAQIRYHNKGDELKIQTRHYYFDRLNHTDDISTLLAAEIKFHQAVEEDKKPPLLLPDI